jgi:hypothetical protein
MAHPSLEKMMTAGTFNMEVRKFLKQVGVTAQREIENGVRAAVQVGRLAGTENLKARGTLEVEGVPLELGGGQCRHFPDTAGRRRYRHHQRERGCSSVRPSQGSRQTRKSMPNERGLSGGRAQG